MELSHVVVERIQEIVDFAPPKPHSRYGRTADDLRESSPESEFQGSDPK
jgi:hypothetical protein